MERITISIHCLKCGVHAQATHEVDDSLLLSPLLMRNNRREAFKAANNAFIAIALDQCNNCAAKKD